jgi:flagellar biosynthesis/type III secretory pathway protein FliH
LGAEALRRIQQAPVSEERRFLLGECVQAYLPLDEQQQGEFERLVATEPYQGLRAMNTTWFEKGVQQGVQQGIQQGWEKGMEAGRREMLREQLEERFGPLAPPVIERFQQLPRERVLALSKAVLRAESLRELGLEG